MILARKANDNLFR